VPLPFEREGFVERVMQAATPRTRIVFASHLSSTTALIFPVAELCRAARERSLPILIDGAHAPGQIDLDLDAIGADFYTGNAHKWLCAPKGAAFLHARPEHHARLHATVTSWGYAEGTGGHAGFDAYLGRSVLERRLQWQGTRDLSAFLAVPAAIGFQRRHDWPAVRRRCHAMAVALMHRVAARHGLPPIGRDDDFAQMVPLPVPHQDAGSLRERLFEQHRIEVPVTQHGGRTFVRVSVQGYNRQADLQGLEDALAAELSSAS
jgi:isopenicillin-N epimerase